LNKIRIFGTNKTSNFVVLLGHFHVLILLECCTGDLMQGAKIGVWSTVAFKEVYAGFLNFNFGSEEQMRSIYGLGNMHLLAGELCPVIYLDTFVLQIGSLALLPLLSIA
jgi:hypothetical protein